MREVLPGKPAVEHPLSEELKEEARDWVEPPPPPVPPVHTEKAADQPRSVRYDLD